ncbi:MAG: pro-sigmaK processing inhibitor BofA family protein [Clostridiales bacterium]|nr:pro-sigmaK processing inhibitor BofA family protein [Clostridiales bacterium]
MKFVETVLIFTAAVMLVAVVGWVMHLKTRGILRIVINSLAGGALIAGLSAFNIIALPLNVFNALLVGILGLPGAGIVIGAAILL